MKSKLPCADLALDVRVAYVVVLIVSVKILDIMVRKTKIIRIGIIVRIAILVTSCFCKVQPLLHACGSCQTWDSWQSGLQMPLGVWTPTPFRFLATRGLAFET